MGRPNNERRPDGLLSAEHRRRIIEAVSDIAVATGAVVMHVGADVAVVPDMVALEGFANGVAGYEPPSTTRDDGRSVWIYRLSDIEDVLRAEQDRQR